MNNKSLLVIAMLSIALIASVVAEPQAQPEATRALEGEDGKQRVEIIGGSYFFKPDHIIVQVNVPVEFQVKREWGIIPHTFVLKIPESGISIDESLDTEPKTITFTPTVVGKFTFYCRNKFLFFKSHEEKGMEGVLEVVQ